VWVASPCDHEVQIIWYQSLAPLIRLYSSEIFHFLLFPQKKKASVQFLLLLDFAAYQKKNCYFIWFLSEIYQLHKKKKEIVQKDIYWFLPQKTK
jgi:hypothetical protein